PEFINWVYPFLQFTINEDLRYRLRSRSPVYACLIAKIANPDWRGVTENKSYENISQSETIIVGTAEIALRSASFWSNEPQYPYFSILAVRQN
ncbi:MAG: hypothetical protein ACFCAD_27550, partial [Pleurocapsa sp.]